MGDYEEEENTEQTDAGKNGVETKKEGAVKGNYVSIHSSGFRDFLLKPEVLRAIVDCGFEHPSEIQHECIPQVTSIFFPLSLGCIKSLIYDDTRRGMDIVDQ